MPLKQLQVRDLSNAVNSINNQRDKLFQALGGIGEAINGLRPKITNEDVNNQITNYNTQQMINEMNSIDNIDALRDVLTKSNGYAYDENKINNVFTGRRNKIQEQDNWQKKFDINNEHWNKTFDETKKQHELDANYKAADLALRRARLRAELARANSKGNETVGVLDPNTNRIIQVPKSDAKATEEQLNRRYDLIQKLRDAKPNMTNKQREEVEKALKNNNWAILTQIVNKTNKREEIADKEVIESIKNSPYYNDFKAAIGGAKLKLSDLNNDQLYKAYKLLKELENRGTISRFFDDSDIEEVEKIVRKIIK
jgi:hypothetical protein